MNSNQLLKEQGRTMHAALVPTLRYLNRLNERLNANRCPPDDRLYRAARKAQTVMSELVMVLHNLSRDGVGNRADPRNYPCPLHLGPWHAPAWPADALDAQRIPAPPDCTLTDPAWGCCYRGSELAPAAIDVEFDAGDVGGVIGGEEEHRPGDLFRRTQPLHGHLTGPAVRQVPCGLG
jgi:hypothetical protein